MIFYRKYAKQRLNVLKKCFADSSQKGETRIYILNDKFSIKPNQEYRVVYETSTLNNEKDQINSVTKCEKYKVFEHSNDTYKKRFLFNSENSKKIHHIFFPRDYPFSVKRGYYDFSKYLFLSSVCFNCMNFISTQVMINSLGINISPLKKYAFSAGLNWVIKDGIGQLGSIFYAAKYSHQMEINLKEWRLFATVLLNASVFMEILTVLLPQHFLLIASLANIIKLTSLTIFGVTRAGIILHFSKDNNVTDLTNKATTQQNLSMLIGNLIGFAISLLFPQSFPFVFSTISLITIYHLYTGIKSANSIIFEEFNLQRFYIFCEEYLDNKNILSPFQVYRKESMYFRGMKHIWFCKKSLDFVLKNSSERENQYLIDLLTLFRNERFFCYVVKYFSIQEVSFKYKIFISQRVDSDCSDILLSFLFAVRLDRMLNKLNNNEIVKTIKENLKFIEEINIKEIIEEMRNLGWIINFSILEEKYCRYHIIYK